MLLLHRCNATIGRWTRGGRNLKKYIHFNTIVRSVKYSKDENNFKVTVEDLKEKRELPAQTFDYVIVASGHFSVPNVPSFPGMADFPGRILHSHDFKDANEFTGKHLLIVSGFLVLTL